MGADVIPLAIQLGGVEERVETLRSVILGMTSGSKVTLTTSA